MKYLLLATALISASTWAKSPDFVEKDVIWLSASMGSAESDNEFVTPENGLNTEFSLGYDFNRYVAIFGGGGVISNMGDDNINFAQFGTKLTYPINQQWRVFTTLGGVSALGSDVSNQLKPSVGIGINYIITPQVSTQFGFNHKKDLPISEKHDADINTFFWGLTYHFGRPDTSNKVIQQIRIVE